MTRIEIATRVLRYQDGSDYHTASEYYFHPDSYHRRPCGRDYNLDIFIARTGLSCRRLLKKKSNE